MELFWIYMLHATFERSKITVLIEKVLGKTILGEYSDSILLMLK